MYKIKEVYNFDNKRYSSIFYQLSHKGMSRDNIIKYIELTDRINQIKQTQPSNKYSKIPHDKLKENNISINTYARARSYLKLTPDKLLEYILIKRERKELLDVLN